jgi:tetratricopeptide (TPR) repeat protein
MILEESVAMCRQSGDTLGVGMSLRDLGHAALAVGEPDRAAVHLRESLALVKAVGHRSNMAWTLWGIAELARKQKDLERARVRYEESLTLLRQDGNKRQPAGTMLELSELGRLLGNFDKARAYLRAVLLEFKRRGWTHNYRHPLDRLAKLLLQSGSYVPGVRLAATVSLAVLVPSYYVNLSEDLADHEAATQAARTTLGAEAFAAAWTEGLAMTLEQAIAYALEDDA